MQPVKGTFFQELMTRSLPKLLCLDCVAIFLSRAEIGETLSRLGVNPHPEQPEQNVGEQEIGEGHVEGDVDIGDGEMEEEEEEEAATHQHQPFRVTPLMIAVAEREAQGWRAIADALKALMVQQQSNPQ